MTAPSQSETPNGTGIVLPSRLHLVQARLGKRERSILLSANAETWVLLIGQHERKEKSRSAISRASTKLEKLKLIERHYDWWKGGERDDSNSTLVTRGEQTYRMYFTEIKVKLTPLGAAVVDQFRDELTSGKRIRWARFNPPPEPPPPEPPPEPVKLTPEQEELQDLRGTLRIAQFPCKMLVTAIERARELAAKLPAMEKQSRVNRYKVKKMERRIAELEAQGVTLPD